MRDARPDVGPSGGQTDRYQPVRRPGIDGMRAVAVTAVVAFHLDRLPGGNLGVDAFFVISGWVITTSLLARIDPVDRRLDLSDFWSARVRRLLPAASVALLAISIVWRVMDIEVASLQRDVLFALGWSANWGTITGGADYWARFGEASPVAHFWSLAVEEQFYLVWPFLLWAIVRTGGRARTIGWVALTLAAGSVATMVLLFDPTNPTDTYVHTGARAHSLLLGAAAAVASVAARRRPWVGRSVRALVLPAALAIVGIVALSDEGSSWLYRWGFPAFAAAMAVVVMWVAELHEGGPFGHRALRWVGDRSYGIYLWHWPVILLLAPPRVAHLGLARDVACIALAVALAATSHRWLEQPIRRSPRVTWRWAPGLALATMAVCALVLRLGETPATDRMAEASVIRLPPVTSSTPPDPGATEDVADQIAAARAAPGSAATVRTEPVRVLVVGDSTAVQLAETLAAEAASQPSKLLVGSAAYGGCGLSVEADGRRHESSNPDGSTSLNDLSGCTKQWGELRDRISVEGIDVVLVSIGAWDGTDIHTRDGEVVSIVDPAGWRLITDSYVRFVTDVRSARARVAWVLPPDLHLEWGRIDTVLNDPDRWAALRTLIQSLPVSEIDLPAWLAEQDLEGPDARPDGVHLAPDVRERFVAEVIVPALIAEDVGSGSLPWSVDLRQLR